MCTKHSKLLAAATHLLYTLSPPSTCIFFCTVASQLHPALLQVYNLTTYPNLVGFLEALDVDTEPSEMSFSLSMDGGKLEWASHDLSTIFVQKRNLLSPSFLRMIYDVIRFGREAPKVRQQCRAACRTGLGMQCRARLAGQLLAGSGRMPNHATLAGQLAACRTAVAL